MNVVPYLIGIAVIVVGLAVSIALHEIGHLVPAKKFGVRVGQYMIGFGPTLWSRTYGETQYGVKAIPLGGYISMAGHVPAVAEGGGRERRPGTATAAPAAASSPRWCRTRARRTTRRCTARRRSRLLQAAGLQAHHHHARRTGDEPAVRDRALHRALQRASASSRARPRSPRSSECVVPAGSTQTECTASDPVAPAAAAGHAARRCDRLDRRHRGVDVRRGIRDHPGVPRTAARGRRRAGRRAGHPAGHAAARGAPDLRRDRAGGRRRGRRPGDRRGRIRRRRTGRRTSCASRSGPGRRRRSRTSAPSRASWCSCPSSSTRSPSRSSRAASATRTAL